MTKGIPAGFISEAAMADRLGKGIPTLRRWGAAGYGPRRFRIGKTIAYRADGDLRWLEGVEMEQPKERPAPRRRGRPQTTSSMHVETYAIGAERERIKTVASGFAEPPLA
jgi:hypothetical protein